LNAQENLALSKGPNCIRAGLFAYLYGAKKRPFALAVTLSIRNIDLDADITLTEVNYYGSKGRRIKSFVDDVPTIKPQESIRFVIAEDEKGGGSGANFIVKWKSDTEVNPPIIESIMIGAQSSQGISFTSRGRAIISN
jgi:5,10-methenyltetrahydromethanopterin hydrogenase